MNEEHEPTPREKIVIQFLSDKMEASANMVGHAAIEAYGVVSGGGYTAVGTGLLSSMRRRGLVMRNELGWRLTQRGRHWAGTYKAQR